MTREIPAALTVEELATGTGYHPKTVRKLIDRGELPGYATSMGYRCPWAWWDDYQHGRWKPRLEDAKEPTSIVALHRRTDSVGRGSHQG